jgi:hypothetical protein
VGGSGPCLLLGYREVHTYNTSDTVKTEKYVKWFKRILYKETTREHSGLDK